MNNKDNYKKALDQIHASDELKEKTFENITAKKNQKRYSYIKYLSAVAVFVLVLTYGFVYINNKQDNDKQIDNKKDVIATAEIDNLPRFKNMQELIDVLKNNPTNSSYGSINKEASIQSEVSDSLSTKNDLTNSDTARTESVFSDFSTTNTQVENVDEADIVKTDGKYIYYISFDIVFIVKADNLEIVSQIYLVKDKERFMPCEMYIKGNKLIVLGNYYSYEEVGNLEKDENDNILSDTAVIKSQNIAKAIVYDITNKEKPEIIRENSLDGNYKNSRMIGDNLYFISSKNAYYYDGIKNEEILPCVKDSKYDENFRQIDCTKIINFENSTNYNYVLVAGFNINNNEEMNVETFFGASSDVIYANENNLYLTQQIYGKGYTYTDSKTIIYKFNLNGSNLKLQCKTEIEGYLDSQFSMDEYEGNLRVATTVVVNVVPPKEEVIGNIVTTTLGENKTTNNLYILNDNLEQIGFIENLGEDERIYSVRFIGKVGYIVTFKQVDPLFVIDLSDPTKPEIKGELKILGYSSYLHPYDETHIIGIGNNVKDNGHGGVTNTSMKMSMFDVSDLENPKELFSVNIGNDYAYSDISHNHKVLFYKPSDNLIGFPVNVRENNMYYNKIVLFKINLENNEFEKFGEVVNSNDYKANIRRGIYIENVLYTLGYYRITSYDLLNNLEKINEINLPELSASGSLIYVKE